MNLSAELQKRSICRSSSNGARNSLSWQTPEEIETFAQVTRIQVGCHSYVPRSGIFISTHHLKESLHIITSPELGIKIKNGVFQSHVCLNSVPDYPAMNGFPHGKPNRLRCFIRIFVYSPKFAAYSLLKQKYHQYIADIMMLIDVVCRNNWKRLQLRERLSATRSFADEQNSEQNTEPGMMHGRNSE
ncbi:polyketide cyclase/dehydrase and lipid transportsuperfamily protein [Striga asiatica]|uniref:Polyketide cyclase/dehydrase and lipid transportsuperfamily protein n=1 Tax=Striga asiatica TaxID=4170 RepID=A0A5A7RI98_STRAF|nr:polyketide cyclase/dehydrase and lipid transportsuperfamily protein [Striga asiatica]